MSKSKVKKKAYTKELALALKAKSQKTKKPRTESEECRKFKEIEEVINGEGY